MEIRSTLKKIIPYSIRADMRAVQRALADLIKNAWRQFSRSSDWKAVDLSTSPYINFGCGDLADATYINIDKSIGVSIIYHDLRDPVPLPNGCVEHINAEHFLEHLVLSDAKNFLNECFRLLKPGGTIRLIVPDAERYMSAYAESNTEFFAPLDHLGGTPEPLLSNVEIVNQMFRMAGGHKFAWDFEFLFMILSQIGFKGIERSAHGESKHNIDGTDWWRKHESLYLNAFRPDNPGVE